VFAEAEGTLGPVSILVNNASSWRKDTLSPHREDPLRRNRALIARLRIQAARLVTRSVIRLR